VHIHARPAELSVLCDSAAPFVGLVVDATRQMARHIDATQAPAAAQA
jgi:hypothetical protein